MKLKGMQHEPYRCDWLQRRLRHPPVLGHTGLDMWWMALYGGSGTISRWLRNWRERGDRRCVDQRTHDRFVASPSRPASTTTTWVFQQIALARNVPACTGPAWSINAAAAAVAVPAAASTRSETEATRGAARAGAEAPAAAWRPFVPVRPGTPLLGCEPGGGCGSDDIRTTDFSSYAACWSRQVRTTCPNPTFSFSLSLAPDRTDAEHSRLRTTTILRCDGDPLGPRP